MDAPTIPADTSFKGCWEQLARDRGLPADPEALMPPTTVAQARRVAVEIFSWGLRHQELTRRRLEEKLPESDFAALRKSLEELKRQFELQHCFAMVIPNPDGPPETIYQPPGRLF